MKYPIRFVSRLATTTLLTTILAALIFPSGVARAQTTINTLPSWNGSNNVGVFGSTDIPTFGQTITAPASPNTSLLDFTFVVRNLNDLALNVIAYVYAWNGTTAIGSALFASAQFTIGTTGGALVPVTVTPLGGVTLTPGSQYLLAFSTVGAASSGGRASFGLIGSGNPYAGGAFEYSGNSSIAGASFEGGGPSDLAFQADFGPALPNSVPDGGSSALLLGLGLAGLFGVQRAVVGGRQPTAVA